MTPKYATSQVNPHQLIPTRACGSSASYHLGPAQIDCYQPVRKWEKSQFIERPLEDDSKACQSLWQPATLWLNNYVWYVAKDKCEHFNLYICTPVCVCHRTHLNILKTVSINYFISRKSIFIPRIKKLRFGDRLGYPSCIASNEITEFLFCYT